MEIKKPTNIQLKNLNKVHINLNKKTNKQVDMHKVHIKFILF